MTVGQLFSLGTLVFPSQNGLSIYMLLLPEGRPGESWEPLINENSFANRVASDRKVLLLCLKRVKQTRKLGSLSDKTS